MCNRCVLHAEAEEWAPRLFLVWYRLRLDRAPSRRHTQAPGRLRERRAGPGRVAQGRAGPGDRYLSFSCFCSLRFLLFILFCLHGPGISTIYVTAHHVSWKLLASCLDRQLLWLQLRVPRRGELRACVGRVRRVLLVHSAALGGMRGTRDKQAARANPCGSGHLPEGACGQRTNGICKIPSHG